MKRTVAANDGGSDSACPVGIFVYGTLKRGQCRESAWPTAPIHIRDAWVRGQLFDRADYPAMTQGSAKVMGQLWCFEDSVLPQVLDAIDEVEGTNQPGFANLYDRLLVAAFDREDQLLGIAHAYFYAERPEEDGFQKMEGTCLQWPVPTAPPADPPS